MVASRCDVAHARARWDASLRVGWVCLGGGSFDMVAMFEIALLIVLAVLAVWWFRRTNLYRNRRRSVIDQAQDARRSPGGESMNGVYGGGSDGGGQ